MATYARRSDPVNPVHSLLEDLKRVLPSFKPERATLFGVITLGALLSFELFNYSTTEYALTDLLGDLRFADVRWATILALAFCGIDFAGIARLFTPEKGRKLPIEVWYLLGAWFLAATMNAMLTWWSVSLAMLRHVDLGNEIITRQEMLYAVPIFVAILVWLIRVLMIGTYTLSNRGRSHSSEPVLKRGTQNQRPLSGVRRPQPAAARPGPQPGSQHARTGNVPDPIHPKINRSQTHGLQHRQ